MWNFDNYVNHWEEVTFSCEPLTHMWIVIHGGESHENDGEVVQQSMFVGMHLRSPLI